MTKKKLISNPSDINLNNRENIQDILGNPPGWLLKWGITLVFFAISLFLFLAWLIKYPDTMEAPVYITSENPPIPIIAKVSGELDTILIKNEAFVEKGSLIARIKTPTNYNNLIEVKRFLYSIQNLTSSNDYSTLQAPQNIELGVLSNSYNALVQRIESFQHLLRRNSDIVKIRSLEKEIKQITKLNHSLEKQENLFDDDLKITEKQFDRNTKLKEADIISEFEMENAESQFLKHKRQLENFKTNRITNDVRIQTLKTQINDIKSERKNQHSNNNLLIRQLIENLNSEIKAWEERFLITSPIEGQLSFNSIRTENQFVRADNPIFTIVPDEGKGETIAVCLLPIVGSGRVKKGNDVLVKLDAYPFQEYGSIKSSVQGFSIVPEQASNGSMNFRLTFKLPDTLVTNYHKTIPFQQNMQGIATIITEERSILQRIFNQLTSLLKN